MTQQSIEPPRRVWSVAEVAKMLDTSEFTVRNLIHAGQIKALTIGRAFKITTEEIDRYLGLKRK